MRPPILVWKPGGPATLPNTSLWALILLNDHFLPSVLHRRLPTETQIWKGIASIHLASSHWIQQQHLCLHTNKDETAVIICQSFILSMCSFLQQIYCLPHVRWSKQCVKCMLKQSDISLSWQNASDGHKGWVLKSRLTTVSYTHLTLPTNREV